MSIESLTIFIAEFSKRFELNRHGRYDISIKFLCPLFLRSGDELARKAKEEFDPDA